MFDSAAVFDQSKDSMGATVQTIIKSDQAVGTAEEFREAMSRLATAVSIVTTDGPAGMAGFTASAVCSVTDNPPTLLVCLNRSASVYPMFAENGVLCVNVLSPSHQSLSSLFGGKTPMSSRFAAASWHTMTTGALALDNAVVALDCRISESVEVGTHDVLFCRPVAISFEKSSNALVYYGRRYHAAGTSE
jgi:flavin reductase